MSEKSVKFGQYVIRDYDYVPYKRKDGKPGNPIYQATTGYYTPLFTCKLCGLVSTPRNVHERGDIYMCDDRLNMYICVPFLCTPCWNKTKPTIEQFYELRKLKILSNKLKRVKYDGC